MAAMDQRRLVKLMKFMEQYGLTELEIEGIKLKRDPALLRTSKQLPEKPVYQPKVLEKVEDLMDKDRNWQLFRSGILPVGGR